MANVLQGKIALVTGVSGEGQVGTVVAAALAGEGASLGIVARKLENVQARGEELRRSGARVLALAADLTNEAEVGKVVERMIAEYSKLDILVNLAGGLTRYKAAIDFSLADWQHEISNNLLTAFLMSRAVLPRMRDAGGGAIINFSRAGSAQANMVAYNCAKAGIDALTRTLALEGRDASIRVNAIAPGLVDTASNVEAMKPKDLKRWTKRQDIAQAVVFLASSGAAGITGQVIPVTGWGL